MKAVVTKNVGAKEASRTAGAWTPTVTASPMIAASE
jgi:hypothetical protein